MKNKYASQTISAIFLVAGTCIGGGMLALPVATAINGFIPSTLIMLCAWLAMTCTALYLVEAGFWMKNDEAHLISMSKTLLGKPGAYTSWILYLFICYASLIAYTAGGGMLFTHALSVSPEMGCLFFTLLFGPSLFLSHKTLGKINASLFLVMIGIFVLLLCLALPKIQTPLLLREQWHGSWMTLSLLLTAFSFQTLVPSLHPYLNHHGPSLRVAIIGGTALAFIVYLIWQITVLGIVPLEGPNGLLQAYNEGQAATHALGKAVGSSLIELLATLFAFFALATSYLGISLGLYDFLSDGLKITKKGWGNICLGLLIILPTYIGSIAFERVFLSALNASGGFGDAILNGIIPVLMIVIGRYYMKLPKTTFHAPGGRGFLLAAFLFYVSALAIEVLSRLGHLTLIHTLD